MMASHMFINQGMERNPQRKKAAGNTIRIRGGIFVVSLLFSIASHVVVADSAATIATVFQFTFFLGRILENKNAEINPAARPYIVAEIEMLSFWAMGIGG